MNGKVCYIHTVEYYSVIKKWSTDICYTLDELQKHYAEKPDKKVHIHDSIYMKCPGSQIHRYRK